MMTSKAQQEINISAVFDAFVYLDDQSEGYEGAPLKKIMDEIGCNYEGLSKEEKQYFNAIQDAIRRMPELENYTLVSQSSLTGIPTTLLFACTFKSPDDDYYVAYRGTGDGKWLDNGEGMYKPSTIMQETAARYFDMIVEKGNLSESDNIIVTGHSKGGNSAQYVALVSEHADLIDTCYSLNGQGFSKKAIAEFQRQLGNRFQVQINKMYSINGENDYVHDLGIPVVPADRTFFVPTPEGTSLGGMHGLQYMIVDGEILLDLNDPVQQGPIGRFAKKLSGEMMNLSDEDLEDFSLSIMSLIERYMGNGEVYKVGTGTEKFADIEEFCGFISVGIPMILKTAITTEEGRAAVGTIAMDAIDGLSAAENGGKMIVAMCAVVLVCAPAVVMLGQALLPAGVAVWKGVSMVDSVLDLFNDTFELSDVKGAILVAKIIAKAATFLAANTHIVVAVLAVVAVVSLVTYLIQHWDEIKAFIKATGDFFAGLATALYAWAENLVTSAVNLIKAAIGKAVDFFQNVKQAIIDFGNRLMSEAISFFTKISQAIIGFLGSIAKWEKDLFGGGSSALGAANQIAVTISRIEELQRHIATLRSVYLDTERTLSDAEGVVRGVYSYYKESYVRSCCRDIQNNLDKAEKYIRSTERELDRKRKSLATAVELYHRSDQTAARDIRRAVASFM